MRSQRTSLVPLFKLGDEITKVKVQMDETLDSCGAAVMTEDNPEAGYSGWGQETVSAVFRPLLSPPQIDLETELDELELDDLGLDPDTVRVIQKRAKAKLDLNLKSANMLNGPNSPPHTGNSITK